MRSWTVVVIALALAVAAAPALPAQTSTPGTGVDVEVVNPGTGGNEFCVVPGDSFSARVYVRPGSTSEPCPLACGTAAGGTSAIATAALDLQFDSSSLVFEEAESNPATAAADGLIQLQNLAGGRVGWALAGDWTPNARASSDPADLADPCTMGKLSGAGWVLQMDFILTAPVASTLHLRRASGDGFPLSFADACARTFREDNGLVDEVVDGAVRSDCAEISNIIFRNGFDSGNDAAWRSPA